MAAGDHRSQSDEVYARLLQAQFNEEADELEKAEAADRKFAQNIASQSHTISDSDEEVSLVCVSPSKETLRDSSQKKERVDRQSSSLHKISDSDEEIKQISKGERRQSPKTILKPSHEKRSSDNESNGTIDLSSDEQDEKETNLSNNNKSRKSQLKKACSSIHEISDSDESDSLISPVKTSKFPSKSLNKKATTSPAVEPEPSTSRKRTHSPVNHGNVVASEKPQGKSPGKPKCKFGKTCYRRNSSHRKQFWHPESSDEEGPSTSQSPALKKQKTGTTGHRKLAHKLFEEAQPLSFFMTSVAGIDDKYNASLAIGIKEILSPSMGNITRSAQFNYKIDIPWLMEQYPPEFRDKPLLIVHGASREEKLALQEEASNFENVRLCQAKLEIAFGTHHTKMMFLQYDSGLRIVIHTSNLIHQDWYQKSQGVWISPVFPKLETASASVGDSFTNFKRDMLEYLAAYKSRPMEDWQNIIKEYDFSEAKVHIIGSVPGRHTGARKSAFGHLKLRKVLNNQGPIVGAVKGWPVIGQFSSVGSMGKDADNWLCGEWLLSLSANRKSASPLGADQKAKLHLIYPSKDNVRLSLEGYPAGGSLPYSISTAKKQPFLHEFFHQWKSDLRGRSPASPHIKTYTRVSPSWDNMAWFLVTSANLSKAAWGMLEKTGSQLMIRSYEIGVLFLPQHFGSSSNFRVMKSLDETRSKSKGLLVFPVPFDLPLTPYNKGDRPWIWDIPYADKPDTHGMQWCPR